MTPGLPLALTPRLPLGPHSCNAFALTPGLPLGLTPWLPLGLLSSFPLARTLVIPFAFVASPKLGLRHHVWLFADLQTSNKLNVCQMHPTCVPTQT